MATNTANSTSIKTLFPVHIKLFRDISLSDMEKLFPDTNAKLHLRKLSFDLHSKERLDRADFKAQKLSFDISL